MNGAAAGLLASGPDARPVHAAQALFCRLPYRLRQRVFRQLRPQLAAYYERMLHGQAGAYSLVHVHSSHSLLDMRDAAQHARLEALLKRVYSLAGRRLACVCTPSWKPCPPTGTAHGQALLFPRHPAQFR